MSVLTAAVDATEKIWNVSDDALILSKAYPVRLQIESEKIDVVGSEPVGSQNLRWTVNRAVDGTVAASHAAATAVTLVSDGGGSLTVTDGTTSVAATTLHMANTTVVDAGGGTATATPVSPLSWGGSILVAPSGSYIELDASGSLLGAADGAAGLDGGSAGLYAGGGDGGNVSGGYVVVDPGRGTGAGSVVRVYATDAEAGSGTQGGDVRLRVGAGDGAGRNGQFILTGLPTADPHVAGALYSVAGVLHVSAG